MKGLKKRVLAALCVMTMLAGVIWQGGLQQVVNAAEESNTDFAREWEIIGADDTALTVVDTTAGSVVKAGSKSDCNINLPDDISEGNLALYVKLNITSDETALGLLNTYKNTYIELCNEKADQGERNWEISSQGGLKNGENEFVLRFDDSSFHLGTNGMTPFDYRETINFFRFYTGNSNNSYTTDMSCKVEVTELRIVYTNAGLEFGQDGDDTYLQLSNTLSENPTTIEASIKKDVIEPEATEWTLVNAKTITCTDGRLSWGGAFDVKIPEEYVTSLENIADSQLAISFTITSDQSLPITEGQLEVTDKGSIDDVNEIRVNLGGKSLNIGANEYVLPLKDFVHGTSASIDLAKLNYIRFYTQPGVTGTFQLSDVKLYVMQEEEVEDVKEWTLGVAANGYSTDNTNLQKITAEGAEPGTDIAYQLNTVSAATLKFWQANTITLPENYYTSTSDLANSDLAVAFWLYVEDDVKFGNIDARFQLTAKGASDYTIRYMIRDLNTLTAGWNYVVLPLRLFVSNQTTEVSITGFDKFYLYAVNQSNSFGLADVKLIVLEEDLDTNWKLADGFIYDSSRNSGDKYSYVGATAYMGTVQPDEEGPESGATYAETTLSNSTLKFARTLTNPIPEKYKLNSVEDRLTSKLAVSMWMYSSVATVLSNGQLELTSSGARKDAHEIRYNTGKHPITLSTGWNYVIMPFSQFDYTDDSTDGTLDLANLNYLYFYDNASRTQTIRITDIKMVDTDPETIIKSEYVSDDTNEMIFSNTGANDTNQTALFVTEEGYLAYVEGDKQYTLKQNVCTGDWVDVAVVRDTYKIIFYIDGEKAGYCSTSARTGTAPDKKHSIGADGTGSQLFDGFICDVRIWKDVRTADEIKDKLVDKNTVALASNNLDMADESLIGSWFLVGDIQYVLDTMPDNAGGNHAVFCGSRAKDWVEYTVPEELGEDYWSMVFIPDIQNLVTGKYTRLWYDMAEWIADNIETENVKHIVGAGDSTWSNTDNEYKYAKNGFDKFTDLVSWSNMIGNHDYVWGNNNRDSAKYNANFGLDYISSTGASSTYKGSYDDPNGVSGVENSYYTFSVNGVKWMILQLEYYPRRSVLTWANSILEDEKYADYNVILTTHAYLDGNGNYVGDYMKYTESDDSVGGSLGTSTETIWETVVKPHTNIQLVLCGHSTNGEGTIATKSVTNDAGESVEALMMNVQDLDMTDSNGADTAYYSGQALGAVNILRFSADGTQVAVQQYAPGYEKSFDVASNAITMSLNIVECVHKNQAVYNVDTPTEKNTGYTGDTYCTECGTLVKAGTVIPATGIIEPEEELDDNGKTDVGNGSGPQTDGNGKTDVGNGSGLQTDDNGKADIVNGAEAQTGDMTNIVTWIMILTVSGIAVLSVLLCKKKRDSGGF